MTSVAPFPRRARIPIGFLVAVLVAAVAAPAASVTEEEVERSRRAREEAAATRAAALEDLNQAVAAYEELNGEYQSLVFRTGQLRSRIEAYEKDVRRLRDQIRERAVEAYMNGPERDAGIHLFSSGRAQQAVVAREVLAQAVSAGAASLGTLEAVTAEMGRLRQELAVDTGLANDLRVEAEAVAARMYELLAEREAELASADQQLRQAEGELAEQRRREEEERQRREMIRMAMLGPAGGVPDDVTPGFICPVAGASAFVDSWGAPRPGGRTHKGVDLMGVRGTPLVAVADGVIEQGYGILGGNTVWLYADHGVGYFYAHLDGFVAGQVSGQWVSRGTVIGYMGDTGNPAPGAYHLHFGIYPAGMGAVNPYPTVARHCN